MKYKLLGNLKAHGTFYQKGQEVELPDTEETQKLVTDGLIEALEEKKEEIVVEKPKTRKKRK